MRRAFILAMLLAIIPTIALAQRKKKSDDAFARERPAIGDALPDLVVYDPSGKEISTARLRGHYTVLAFGCLT